MVLAAVIIAYSLPCLSKGRPVSVFREAGTLFGSGLNLSGFFFTKKSDTLFLDYLQLALLPDALL